MNGIFKAFHFRVVFVCFEAKHQVAGIVVEVGGVGGPILDIGNFQTTILS